MFVIKLASKVEVHEHQVKKYLGIDDALAIPDDSSSKVTDSTSTKSCGSLQ